MSERSSLAARRFGRLFAVLGILCLATAGSALAQDDSLRTAYRLTNTSIAVTDTDLAARYGLKIEPVKLSTGVEANEAILTGAVDVAELGITPFVTSLSRSSDLVAIGVANSGGGLYRTVVRIDSPYQSMDDLRGKKIAIRVGSGNYSAFLTYIGQRGWKETDFQIVNSGDQEAIAALSAGSVDAVIYWEPIVSVLIAKGIARPIFSFKGVVENPIFLVANRKSLARSPRAFAKFVAAYMDGQDLLTNDVPAAAALVTSVMSRAGQQIDGKVIEMSIPAVDYRIDLTASARADALANFQLLKKAGKLRAAEPDWSIAFDPSVIEAARQIRTK